MLNFGYFMQISFLIYVNKIFTAIDYTWLIFQKRIITFIQAEEHPVMLFVLV